MYQSSRMWSDCWNISQQRSISFLLYRSVNIYKKKVENKKSTFWNRLENSGRKLITGIRRSTRTGLRIPSVRIVRKELSVHFPSQHWDCSLFWTGWFCWFCVEQRLIFDLNFCRKVQDPGSVHSHKLMITWVVRIGVRRHTSCCVLSYVVV